MGPRPTVEGLGETTDHTQRPTPLLLLLRLLFVLRAPEGILFASAPQGAYRRIQEATPIFWLDRKYPLVPRDHGEEA